MKFTMGKPGTRAKVPAPEKPWPPLECRLPPDDVLEAMDIDHDLELFFWASLQKVEAYNEAKDKAAAELREQITNAADPLKRKRLPEPGKYWMEG